MSSQHSGPATTCAANATAGTTSQGKGSPKVRNQPDKASLARMKETLEKGGVWAAALEYFVSIETSFVRSHASAVIGADGLSTARATTEPGHAGPSKRPVKPAFVQVASRLVPMNQMHLRIPFGSKTMMPGDQIDIPLALADLTPAINGAQALICYDTSVLGLQEIELNEDPELGWTLVYQQHDPGEQDRVGKITYAAAIFGGSVWCDCTVATLRFIARDSGKVRVWFQADGPIYKSKLNRADNSIPFSPSLLCGPPPPLLSHHPKITDISMCPHRKEGQEGTFCISVDTDLDHNDLRVTAVSNQDGAQSALAEFEKESPVGTLIYRYKDPTYDPTFGS